MKKRGQFFLLAAVIISVVVLSLGVTTNQAVFSEEPEDFYDFSYEVVRESGAIIDYEVYSGFDDGANLGEFIELLSKDIQERSPDSDFLFVYGDEEEGYSVKNYGKRDVAVNDEVVAEETDDVENRVCIGRFCHSISTDIGDVVDGGSYVFEREDVSDDEIVVEFSGNKFNFPILQSKQVIFVMEKNVGDETFVTTG